MQACISPLPNAACLYRAPFCSLRRLVTLLTMRNRYFSTVTGSSCESPSDQSCWLAKACKILLLRLTADIQNWGSACQSSAQLESAALTKSAGAMLVRLHMTLNIRSRTQDTQYQIQD